MEFIDPKQIIYFANVEAYEFATEPELRKLYSHPKVVWCWWRSHIKLPVIHPVYDLITRQSKYQICNN